MLEWILSSTVLIGIVIIVRWLFRNRLKVTIRYALWSLVLLRLLLPFSIGKAVISVGNWVETVTAQPTVQEFMEIQVPVQSQESAYQEALEDYRNQGVAVDSLDQNTLNQIRQEAESRVEKKPIGELMTQGAAVIWITGCVLVSGFFLFSNCRFGWLLRKHRRDTGLRKGKLSVYVTSVLESPCLFGMGIYVTETVLADPTLLRHTLEHETTHHRHGDHIWAILRGVALSLHWYNPLVWIAAVLSQRDGEMACDEATVARLGEGERAEYGRTLIGMTCGKKADVLLTATRMTNGSLRQRILTLAKKPKMAAYILAVLVLIAATAAVFTFAGSPPEVPQITDPTEATDEIWDSKPYITYGGTRFYTQKRGIQSLPEGYECIGALSEEDSRDLVYGGYQIFARKDRETLDHFYLYGETGTVVGNTYYDKKKQMAYTLFGTESYILPEQKKAAQEDVFFRKYDPDGRYLGKADGCAVIYSDGEIPRFRVLRYIWEEETVRILEETTVDAALTEGITFNHLQLESGHMYFGSVADPEGTWEMMELTGKSGSKAKITLFGRKNWFTFLNWTVEDFRVLRTDGTAVFNMTEFLAENTVNEVIFPSQEPAQPSTEPPETEPTVPRVEPVPAELDDPNLGPLYSKTDPNRISIRVQLTAYRDRVFYIIPENQDAFLEAYQAAIKQAYNLGGFVASEEASGLYLCYQNDDWRVMTNGALQMNASNRIDPDAAEPLYDLIRKAARETGIQEAVRPEELTSIRKATLELEGSHTVRDSRILRKLEELLSNSTPYFPVKCPLGSMLTLSQTNGETKTIVLGCEGCSVWMSNGAYYLITDGGLEEDFGTKVLYSLLTSELVREAVFESDDPSQWIPFVNWSAYDATYGGTETRKLMEAMKEWFLENGAYEMAFRCLIGLDEEYGPLYGEMLAQLAEADKRNFADAYFGIYTRLRDMITDLLSEHWNLTTEETEVRLREYRDTQ